MDASHPIFRGPFPVELTLHDLPTPEHYRKHPGGDALGDTMPAWRVHAEKVDGYPGVVADGYGFEDSPDAEWIASGRNSKNAKAAALARHGTFFHWGFAASPRQMTDEAKLVFLNTMAYMQRFRGHPPLAVGDQRSREWLRVFANYPGGLSDYARKQLPAAWLAEAGDDQQKLRALVDAELGYVHRVDGRFEVDVDCRRLDLDNREATALMRCVALLSDPAHAPAARRVLERYTGQRFDDADAWQRWLDEVYERLFHSDVLGRFAAAPPDLPKAHRAPR